MSSRKRNNRNMQLLILGTFAITVFLLLLSVFLLFKVGSMQKQIDAIKEAKAKAAQTVSADGEDSRQTLVREDGTAADDTAADDSAEKTEAPTETEESTAETGTEETNIEGKSLVYLTFDDGPSKNTQEILDVLEEYDVKATFFVTGRSDEESMASYLAIVEEGHTIAMHSYSHDYAEIYASVENFTADLDKIQSVIQEATGTTPMVYRFPGGSSNTLSVRKLPMTSFIEALDARGIVYFDWNVDSTDGSGANIDAQVLIQRTEEGLCQNRQNVVLLHDAGDHDTTVEALPQIIEYCMQEGYEFRAITEETPVVHHSTIS